MLLAFDVNKAATVHWVSFAPGLPAVSASHPIIFINAGQEIKEVVAALPFIFVLCADGRVVQRHAMLNMLEQVRAFTDFGFFESAVKVRELNCII